MLVSLFLCFQTGKIPSNLRYKAHPFFNIFGYSIKELHSISPPFINSFVIKAIALPMDIKIHNNYSTKMFNFLPFSRINKFQFPCIFSLGFFPLVSFVPILDIIRFLLPIRLHRKTIKIPPHPHPARPRPIRHTFLPCILQSRPQPPWTKNGCQSPLPANSAPLPSRHRQMLSILPLK